MTHYGSRLLMVLATAALVLLNPQSADAEHCDDDMDYACVHAVGDQGAGAVVTDATVFPGVAPGSKLYKATKRSAGCTDCEWSLVPACLASQPEAVEVGCLGATLSCPAEDDLRFIVYMRQAPGPWEAQGTVCLGPGERPASVTDIGQAVRAEVAKYLPDANPSFQPQAGGIVNLPTIFAAGEPATITTESFDVLGFAVVVTARARWEWSFEDGVVKEFTVPGGVYPDDSVSHTYRGPGAREVSVTTFWRGSFTLDGDGPFPVPGPEVSKTSGPFQVPVREARAELVAG